MHFVIAPDSYKESLTALEVANAIEAGFKEIFPYAHYYKVPVADGGEGTVQAIIDGTNGMIHECLVTGPLGETVEAFLGMTGDGKTAVIEMAAASGLMLVPREKRDPRITTTYGTGEIIKQALDLGARNFIIGIGGSATNDGGIGMLQALGVSFLDKEGKELPFGGAGLIHLDRIDMSQCDPRIKESTIQVACDVDNPLTGINGASAIFGPQKGATPAVVEELDQALAHYAKIIWRDLGVDVMHLPGVGAAGGMGAAALAFLKGTLRPGIAIVMDAVNLDEIIQKADYVITGEGKIDSQTIYGKTPIGVANVAKRYHKPVIGIAGTVASDASIVHEHGIEAIFSALCQPSSLEEALSGARVNVQTMARNIAAVIKMAQS